MDRLPSEARPVPPGAVMLPVPIRLEAEGTEGWRAEITLVRRIAGLGVTRYVVHTEGIVGTLFLPPGPRPHPAVMVVSGGGGGIDEFRGAILASHGYAVLALGHFAVDGRPRGLVNIPLEYFETAIGWMRAQTWFESGYSRCEVHHAAASWHCCSAQPFPRSTRSRLECRAAWCSGHLASSSRRHAPASGLDIPRPDAAVPPREQYERRSAA